MSNLSNLKLELIDQYLEDICKLVYPPQIISIIIHSKNEENLIQELYDVVGHYDNADEIANEIIQEIYNKQKE